MHAVDPGRDYHISCLGMILQYRWVIITPICRCVSLAPDLGLLILILACQILSEFWTILRNKYTYMYSRQCTWGSQYPPSFTHIISCQQIITPVQICVVCPTTTQEVRISVHLPTSANWCLFGIGKTEKM